MLPKDTIGRDIKKAYHRLSPKTMLWSLCLINTVATTRPWAEI